MFIEIDRLKEGISNFTLTTNPQEFEFIHRDATFDDEIKVAVTGIRHEKKIVVGINASTTVKMTCARCLTDFRADLKAEFEFGIELSDSASENVELWEEDFVRVATHNSIVNITKRVRDALLLELPMRPLCDPNCKGLCPSCGANLNIEKCKCKPKNEDNPFYELKELLQRKEKNGSSETATLKHKDKKKKNTLET